MSSAANSNDGEKIFEGCVRENRKQIKFQRLPSLPIQRTLTMGEVSLYG